MKTAIVLDKSYLDAASTEEMHALCDNYEVLISDELFFELITTRPDSKQRCFSKLPDRTNPVWLIPNVGTLLRFELENEVACTPLIRHRAQEDFQFNSKLRDGTYVPEGTVHRDIKKWKAHIAQETNRFIERCAIVHQFFPELSGIEWKDFRGAIQEARCKTATNEDFIRGIYASFLTEDAPANAPKPEVISPAWAFFRWVQCQVLCCLRLFGRYQGKVPEPKGKTFIEKAEHSMLDSCHLIHGSLAGAIATRDDEVREDMRLLLRGCILEPPNSVTVTGKC
ncbi:MAG: hypothetical protein CVV18_06300 [Gammaproteobacteria bacterium HGW-Gammaproteobacteria-8]|nr:MAG: hypothetical protein CVV18_06300 [Gammaproteobacteria bacterium HGW-Gammaproteobacteria-8]